MDVEMNSDVIRVLSDNEEEERDIVGDEEEDIRNSSLTVAPIAKKLKFEGKVYY
jgi:transcription elongation GreA/GreB family factor